jgi:hypothetical protein
MLTKEQIAQVAHEALAEFVCVLNQGNPDWEDYQPSWELAEDSTLAGVELVQEEPNITAEQIHERWVEYKRERGWIHGTVKDERLKQHPNMVPFAELPPGEQLKDHLFIAIVRALSPAPAGRILAP